MSRTDAHRPYWVKTNDHTLDREARHMHVSGYYAVDHPFIDCELAPTVGDRRRRNRTYCEWTLPFHEARWHSAPPRWYVNHVFHAPERVRTRDVLREAAKEWNATRDTDLEPEERQARHSARGMWW